MILIKDEKIKDEKTKAMQLNYCQFLLASQINYTQTYFGSHSEKFSHDQINRYLRGERIVPSEVWANVRDSITLSANGYLLFDDTVASKNYSYKIESVRRQWSGNAKAVIRGIGIVTCVYVNPDIDAFWVIDYRIYDPHRDGKTKINHLLEMLRNAMYAKRLVFTTVLVDSWYASRKVLRTIERFEKIYYAPIKCNRNVDDSDGISSHKRVDQLSWSESDKEAGKWIHLKGFPKGHRVKLFRLVLCTKRTEYIVTNDMTQDSTDATHDECRIRWKIEQFHREAKQVTGLEKCQCRKQRAQRNHIGCAMLVWVRLNQVAVQTGQTIYQLKQSLLDDYMRHQLRSPSISMTLA